MFVSNLDYPQSETLELMNYRDGMKTVPGYIVECVDGHSYLVFAPDIDSLKHMYSYHNLMKRVKERLSDHIYDPIRKCIYPAWSFEKDEYGNHKVFHAPASEMGKIFLVK